VRPHSLFILLTAALVQACSCDSVPKGAVTNCEQAPPVPAAVRTDILFVIDDSGSMNQEQTNLQTNLGNFIQGLKDSPVANDFQLGVTTTSVQTFDGSFSTTAGRPYEQGAFVGTPKVLLGSSPTLVADFQSRVIVGTGGSGKEQPFWAMKLALSSPLIDAGGANEGFLRPGARLAIVILSDEDDCSDSAATKGITQTVTSAGNDQCHNDYGDGVDYKFTRIDPIADYVSFLIGPIGPAGDNVVRDVAIAAIVGVDGATKLPTCGNTADSWCCGSGSNDVCVANTCGSNSLTLPGATPPNVTSATWCCGDGAGGCSSTCSTAYDKADRFAALLANFPADRALTASICDASFADTLTQIGCMLVPQDVPLDGAPADWRMMTVGLAGGGTTTPCEVTVAGSANEATADAVYDPPSGGQPAMLHFQNGCRLGCGKQIEIDLICAG
jgi:hypothetical protein